MNNRTSLFIYTGFTRAVRGGVGAHPSRVTTTRTPWLWIRDSCVHYYSTQSCHEKENRRGGGGGHSTFGTQQPLRIVLPVLYFEAKPEGNLTSLRFHGGTGSTGSFQVAPLSLPSPVAPWKLEAVKFRSRGSTTYCRIPTVQYCLVGIHRLLSSWVACMPSAYTGAVFFAGVVLGGACVAYVGTRRSRGRARRRKKVFVSGCFDLLHSGHIAFFKEAAEMGDLYVSVGNDANVTSLKAKPMFPEHERVYMVSAIRWVHKAFVAKGMGHDQGPDLDFVKPDIFFVNEDGDKESKRNQCAERGIEYVVAVREPDSGLDHARQHYQGRAGQR